MFLVAQLKVSASYEDLLRGFCTSATRATLARSRRWFGDEFCRRLCFIWSPLLIPTRFTFSHKPFSILYFHKLLSLSFRFFPKRRKSGRAGMSGYTKIRALNIGRSVPVDGIFMCPRISPNWLIFQMLAKFCWGCRKMSPYPVSRFADFALDSFPAQCALGPNVQWSLLELLRFASGIC